MTLLAVTKSRQVGFSSCHLVRLKNKREISASFKYNINGFIPRMCSIAVCIYFVVFPITIVFLVLLSPQQEQVGSFVVTVLLYSKSEVCVYETAWVFKREKCVNLLEYYILYWFVHMTFLITRTSKAFFIRMLGKLIIHRFQNWLNFSREKESVIKWVYFWVWEFEV